MKEIEVPDYYNYIGIFLTLRCNLNCSYCINKQGEFSPPEELSTPGWIDGLSRIQTRADLPITLQGGEPTIHPGFYQIVESLWLKNKHMDLLTNGTFDLNEFCAAVGSNYFKRSAKYASIRFSFHEKTNATALALKVWTLQNLGYEVGIWGLDWVRDNVAIALFTQLNIDYREKEFLGWDEYGNFRGTYKYPRAVNGEGKKVWCRPSELLINPAGYIFRCHADLYANRDFIGHILDDEVKFPGFMECKNFGKCNPCDVKLKTNRLQEEGHCSVEIKGKEVKTIWTKE